MPFGMAAADAARMSGCLYLRAVKEKIATVSPAHGTQGTECDAPGHASLIANAPVPVPAQARKVRRAIRDWL